MVGIAYNLGYVFVLLGMFESSVGCKFIITSDYRNESHNKEVGGVSDSKHLRGLALDIVPKKGCSKSYNELAIEAKEWFDVVVVYDTHLHVHEED
jgi:hypothetical protein